MTDLKLGIVLWAQGTTWPDMLDAARRVDRLGYDSLWTWDHLLPVFGDRRGPIFDGPAAIAALAMVTTRVRLGLFVGGNTFRNPALFAKSVATLDHISGGRAIYAALAGPGSSPSTPRPGSRSVAASGSDSDGSMSRWLRSERFSMARASPPRRGPITASRHWPSGPAHPAATADPRRRFGRETDAPDRCPIRRHLECVRHAR